MVRNNAHQTPHAETLLECERRWEEFAARYRELDPKTVETPCRDWERLVTFIGFVQTIWPLFNEIFLAP